jgi:hypothetical protein
MSLVFLDKLCDKLLYAYMPISVVQYPRIQNSSLLIFKQQHLAAELRTWSSTDVSDVTKLLRCVYVSADAFIMLCSSNKAHKVKT